MTFRHHITIAALLNAAFALLWLALGALVGAARAGSVSLPLPADDAGQTSRWLLLLQVMCLVDGALGLLVAWGLYRLKPWARVLGIVLGALALTAPAIGVAFGVYTLWVLLSEGGSRVFSEQGQVHLYTHASGFGGAAAPPASEERPPPCSCLFMLVVWVSLHLLLFVPMAILHGPDPRGWPLPAPPAGGAPAAGSEAAPQTRVRRVRAVEGLPGHYTYTDESGRVHIVDDFGKVPERYR